LRGEIASYPNSISRSLSSSSHAVKYDDDETVDEIDGREQASKDATDDAEEDDEDEEVKDGMEKDDWNKGVGGTIISISALIGSIIVGNRSRIGVLGDREKERGVLLLLDPSADGRDSPEGAPRK
jgi:hypothetical protein